MMLEFREAAATNDILGMTSLSLKMGDDFKINEAGPKSGKTATHVAALRANFQAIYWLFEKGADFHCKDNTGKTAIDYLQQKEFTSINSSPTLKGDRKYYLCNAHYKVWLAHDPEIFMPYLYQDDFKQYREKNPEGYISLVYSKSLLSDMALKDLEAFAEKYKLFLISFEEDLDKLTQKYGTDEDKSCYKLASYELKSYPNQGGGNLAVVADLIRWSSVLLRKGNYSDTDVEIGQHKWTDSIAVDKSVALNLGSLIYSSGMMTPWLNGDIIAASSLLPKSLCQGDFRITLSKTACFILRMVQQPLMLSCQSKMQKRILNQQFVIKIFSDVSLYMQDYFKSCGFDKNLTNNFSSNEITKIKEQGLILFSEEEKTSILERLANLKRKEVEQQFDTPEMAQEYSNVLKNVKDNEHEKLLIKYTQAIQMSNIKESVKQLCGSPIFSKPLWECIGKDDWEKYSIYSNEDVQSAFRSTNTVKFDTHEADNERDIRTKKLADLSFTPFGMADVLKRSQALKDAHLQNFK